jgi:tetratricopeptide (TPR) repeat protein
LARPETLEVFRALVAPEASEAFDRGVSLLEEGQYGPAETTLKGAINVETNSTAPLTYLAAVFAASGHDVEAAGVWQTALIEGSDRPEIYGWLGDALLRSGSFRQARLILEEADEKWPGDARFLKPLAMLYATLGQGREAVRTLRRYLDGDPDDIDALALGVEWIYFLHSEGYVAYSPNEDREIARSWADSYHARGGSDAALVGQWIESLEGRTR